MNGVSKIGLLKIDLLGLSNLTVIAEAAELVRAHRGIDLDIDRLPLDDAKTYELLCKADTHGIFQMEATFAKRILIDMQPNCLADLGVAVALNRPGPIEGGATGMWMRRKRGEEPVTYMLPELEPILKETYGAILYQDQVMKIASAVAGFSLGEADILRAAMGKKDKVKMAKQREQFLSGAAARGVAAETALELFELIALFAGYGFNGAHSHLLRADRVSDRVSQGELPARVHERAAQQPRGQLRQAQAIDPRLARARPGRPAAGCQPECVRLQSRRRGAGRDPLRTASHQERR